MRAINSYYLGTNCVISSSYLCEREVNANKTGGGIGGGTERARRLRYKNKEWSLWGNTSCGQKHPYITQTWERKKIILKRKDALLIKTQTKTEKMRNILLVPLKSLGALRVPLWMHRDRFPAILVAILGLPVVCDSPRRTPSPVCFGPRVNDDLQPWHASSFANNITPHSPSGRYMQRRIIKTELMVGSCNATVKIYMYAI